MATDSKPESDREATRHFEGPLRVLDLWQARRRRLLAELADLEAGIAGQEEEICRALRRARARGVAVVVFGDTAYSERDGRLHAESAAPAHAVRYEPEGQPWREHGVVKLGPTPMTAESLYGTVGLDGDGMPGGEEDRSC